MNETRRRFPRVLVPGLLLGAFGVFACGGPDAEPYSDGDPLETGEAPAAAEAASGTAGAAPSEPDRASGSDAPAYRDLSPREMAERMEDPDLLVVNVHIPFEGEIPGTDLHLPFNALDEHLGSLPEDLDAPLAVYCMGDGMSLLAADALAGVGYSNLVRLDGGMVAWSEEGFALEGVSAGDDER